MDLRVREGLATELLAANYFVKQNYEIFWPLQTGSRCDFVIYKDNVFLKVQVKKATWSQTGNYKYLQARVSTREYKSKPKYTKQDFDLIIFIDENKSMWITSFENIEGMTSVCLGSTNPKYKPQTRYNPNDWKVH